MNDLLQAFDTAHGWLPVLLARLTQVLVPFFGPGDLELAVPQALFLLPLPALVWALLPPYRERVESVRTPFFEEVAAASGQKPRKGAEVMSRTIFQLTIAVLGWVLILAAAARPEWVEPPLRKTDSARDLLLAVDLSQSMEARDFKAPDGRRPWTPWSGASPRARGWTWPCTRPGTRCGPGRGCRPTGPRSSC